MTEIPIQSVLSDMLASAERIVQIHRERPSLDGPVHANDALAAILYNFVIVGEAAARLGDRFHQDHPEIPWRIIIDHRIFIAHGYDTVDTTVLAKTITRDLPEVVEHLKRILND